jgi:vanillate O-demethylase ferredoxin subunit
MNELQVRVRTKNVEAEGVCSFELVADDGGLLPTFSAGAHIDVYIAPGLIRQYSLCNAPSERDRYRVAVLLEPQSRGGSSGMHEKIQVGDLVRISHPKNHFELTLANHSLLLAGGIGVTPILSMAHTLHVMGKEFEMHYCGRSADRMAFLSEIGDSAFVNHVKIHTDDGLPELKFDADGILANPSVDTHLYVCGPSGFMDYVLATARRHGWSENQLHREYFAGVDTKQASDATFEVRIASSGKIFQIPADKSVIDVLTSNGVDIPFSCESGVCGTCLTGLLEGIPDHRDTYLTDAEREVNNQFTPCCSRAKSPLLVLNI